MYFIFEKGQDSRVRLPKKKKNKGQKFRVPLSDHQLLPTIIN